MTDQGCVTLPRGHHHLHHHCNTITTANGPLNGHLHNGHPPSCTQLPPPKCPQVNGTLSNGCAGGNGSPGGCGLGSGSGREAVSARAFGGRSIHDGFATIRTGAGKRGRARSSPSVVNELRSNAPCHHGCCNTTLGRTWGMEPLWEEKGNVEQQGAPPVAKRDRAQLPWWEVATRRSKYRSCPAFSQANVVNALEQTMSNVTDKLEKLASSPDLKDTEAAELRKTAAVLRQQSSAVCQSVSSGKQSYFSMERQLSCDSVSSVTSTISAASMSSFASFNSRKLSAGQMQHFPHSLTHPHPQGESLNSQEQSKLKKRSWLRSSFRRAFGRHGRKRSKQGVEGTSEDCPQELPMHHTVNSAVRQLPPPPPPPSTQSVLVQSQPKLLKQQKGNFHVPTTESETVAQLRQEVAEKERALTDCRLEVLSAQHQLQAQADTITRLQGEVTTLQEENNRLTALVRQQYGPAADALLTPLSHTLTGLTLTRNTIRNSITGGNISPREEGRRVKVMVVGKSELATALDAGRASVSAGHLTHIGSVTIEAKTSWEELDAMIANTLKDYGNRIDPVSALGLDGDSILCYRIDDIIGAPNLSRPELLPYGYCVGDVDSLHIWLKGGNQRQDGEAVGNVSTASFINVTPATSLKRLANLLVEHRRLVLAGPPSCGKTFLANALAEFFITNSGRELTEDAIKTFTVTGSNSLEMCQMLSSLWPRGLSSTGRCSSSLSNTTNTTNTSAVSSSNTSSTSNHHESSPALPAVIIIDDIHAAGGVVETLQRCLPASIHSGPAIIATSCPTAALATRLHIHCNFRWATLSTQQEPVRGLLGRVLRRRVVAAEVAANTRLPDAHHLAEWLTRLWLHLNTLLSGHCGSHEVGVGPGLLIDCPMGQEETQVWFTEIWNTRLVPHIIATVKASSTSSTGLLDTWTDPLDWVLATYPWHGNAACGPDQLTRIPVSDVSQQSGNTSSSRLSPLRAHVPLSIHQQISKSESVYATPQLSGRGPLIQGSALGTGQTGLISSRSSSTSSFAARNHVTVQADSSESGVNSLVSSSRKRSDSNTSVSKMEVNEKRDSSVDGAPPLPLRRYDSNNQGKSLYSSLSRPKVNIHENRNSCELMNGVEVNSTADETSDEAMESDSNSTGSVKDAEIFKSTRPVEPIYHSIGMKNKIIMDADGKLSTFNKKPQPLDVLAKNAINACGLSPDCVKIIHGSKRDLKDISKELTTTFKPVETAM
ncbi:neuron navigator 3-like isoform X4 [Penaeus chinensis]|nr:neuron navigator 3-like isoform X4 [Penaeus chinensis]XP_047477203.1 neuron navigator 3-like isoform X4 [Penaeus chinensis]